MDVKVQYSRNQKVQIFEGNNIKLYIKREDELHSFISGNKFRKLKYNLLDARVKQQDTLLTFGGAFSNHIAAVAYAGFSNGFKTIGVIRGEELESKISENPTLAFAQKHGMKFKFISREIYREKDTLDYKMSLRNEFDKFYLIPEGGTNTLAVEGCEEILTEMDADFDFICCPVGTGGTISGLINTSKAHQKVLGFSALKGNFLIDDISTFVHRENWRLITDYHFGGYAKINKELIVFLNTFKINYGIPLDPVYTGKMMYGIINMIKKDEFPENSKILAVHTGGLQGIEGMNIRLKQKKLPLLNYR